MIYIYTLPYIDTCVHVFALTHICTHSIYIPLVDHGIFFPSSLRRADFGNVSVSRKLSCGTEAMLFVKYHCCWFNTFKQP